MLCENIKEIRRRKGLTETQLANLIGVQRAVISKYESGMIEPPIKTLQKIANALEVPMYELLGMDSREGIHAAFVEAIENGKRIQGEERLREIADNLEKLNAEGQQEAVKRVKELTHVPGYQKK